MQEIFKSDTKILISDICRKKLFPQKNKINFVMPALLYKVSLPHVANKVLNFFQRTILELLNYKYIEPFKLSEMLLLNEDLIIYIIKELEGFGYYDNKVVTERGRQALKNIYEGIDPIVGYCIYNVFSKKFMDYFILEEELKCFEVDYFYKNNKLTLRPFMYDKEYEAKIINYYYNNEMSKQESIKSINEAYQKYIKQYKKSVSHINMSIYDREVIDYKIDVDRIEIFNNPISCYITTYAYKNVSSLNRGVLVAHPFFDTPDLDMTRFFEENIKLKDIEYIMDIASGYIISDYDKKLDYQKRKEKILSKLSTILDNNFLTKYKEIVDTILVDLLYNYLKLYNKDLSSFKLNSICSSFIIYLYQSFEFIFSYSIRDKAVGTVRLTNKASENSKMLTKIALDMEFINEKDCISLFLSKVSRSSVYVDNKFRDNVQDLPTLIVMNLLIAIDDIHFPFNNLSISFSDLFLFLFNLRNIRNSQGHDGNSKCDIEDSKKYFDYFLGVLSVMFDAKINYNALLELKEIVKNDDFKGSIEESEKIVIQKLGYSIRDDITYDNIYNSLISMQNYFDMNNDVSIIITRIFEQLLKLLIYDLGHNNIINIVYNYGNTSLDFEFIENMEEYLSTLGFTLYDGIPSWLKNRWKSKHYYIAKAKEKNNRYLLSDLIMFLIIFSKYDDKGEKLLKEIAIKENNFFTYLFRYGDRAHNNLLNTSNFFNYDSYKKSVENTYLCVKTIMSIRDKN